MLKTAMPDNLESKTLAIQRAAGNISRTAARYLAIIHDMDPDPSKVEAFLAPKWAHLIPGNTITDFSVALDLVSDAVTTGTRMGIFGDYDVDGLGSLAMWVQFLRAVHRLGITTVDFVYLPGTRGHGYGLTEDAVRRFHERGVRLLVALDVGSHDHEAVILAKDLGMTVVVIDHHEPDRPYPSADAFVNPKREDSPFPFRDMATVGLSFYFLYYLALRLGPELPDSRAQLLYSALRYELADYAAMGTISDVAPMLGPNRVLVRKGMEAFNRRERRLFRRGGMAALMKLAHFRDPYVSYRDISFRIAPRLNAAGRMGDPSIALEVLLAEDINRAMAPVRRLEELNTQRRRIQEVVFTEAARQVEQTCPEGWIVLGSSDWPDGIVGIAAARLVDRFGRPAIVLHVDEHGMASGSARAGGMVALDTALASVSDLLERHGGHKEAAGLTLRADLIPSLKDALDRLAPFEKTAEEYAVVDSGRVELLTSPAFMRDIPRLAPFGAGNPPPLLEIVPAIIEPGPRRGGDLPNCTVVDPDTGYKVQARWRGAPADVDGRWRLVVEVDVKATAPSVRRSDGRFDVPVQFVPEFHIKAGERI